MTTGPKNLKSGLHFELTRWFSDFDFQKQKKLGTNLLFPIFELIFHYGP